MERINVLTFRAVNYFLDFCLLTTAFVVGFVAWWLRYAGRFDLELFAQIDFRILLIPYFLFYGSNFIFLALVGAYRSSRLQSQSSALINYARSICLGIVAITLANVFFPFVPVSRTLLVVTGLMSFLFLWAKEVTLRALLISFRDRGAFVRRTLIVGENIELIERIVEECRNNTLLGIDAVGIVYPKLEAHTEEFQEKLSIEVVGNLTNFVELIDTHCPDLVILLGRDIDPEILQEALWICEERGLESWIKLDLLERVVYQARLELFEGIPFITLRGGPLNPGALLIKHTLDRITSLILLVLLSPIMLLAAIIIRVTSNGPILFKQRRAGLNGRVFDVLKFRSMVVDAEEQKHELMNQNEMTGPAFKLKDDPRITQFGKFIRKSSIDELPQLWNVFRGEMSLVGPRPMDVKEADQLQGWHRRRLSMKPGITCIWQVAGRNEIREFDDWAQMDLEYIDNWSLWFDLVLLIKTVPVVIFGRGAS